MTVSIDGEQSFCFLRFVLLLAMKFITKYNKTKLFKSIHLFTVYLFKLYLLDRIIWLDAMKFERNSFRRIFIFCERWNWPIRYGQNTHTQKMAQMPSVVVVVDINRNYVICNTLVIHWPIWSITSFLVSH